MRVKDASGNIIPGLLRNECHGLVVDNQPAYEKYLRERERIEKINTLEDQVKQLTALVQTLLADKK